MKISDEVYQRLLNNSINEKQNKYKNKKIVYNNIRFDSKKEYAYYIKLKMLEDSGIIQDLKRQVKYELQPSYKFKDKTIRAINYIADFEYIENGIKHIIDVKGIRTEVYKIKKKLFEYKYNIEIEEV